MAHPQQLQRCSCPAAERSRPVVSLPARRSATCSSSLPARRAATQQQSRTRSAGRRHTVLVAAGEWTPPTVAETKQKFYEGFRQPLPGVYNTILQELLVQQHLMRHNRNYQYDPVFGLGFVSVFDQVLEGLAEGDKEAVFKTYIGALGESPDTYKQDAERLEKLALELSGPEALAPSAEGDELQKVLAEIGERAKAGKFHYTKFFAIGLFRLLELTKAKDPKALEALVKSVSVRPESVNRDLMAYKGVLSKLSAAKELLREMTAREKVKAAEREAEKKAKAEALAKKAEAAGNGANGAEKAAEPEKQPA